MAKQVIIQHSVTRVTKTGYYGFSWTYAFFGWCVPAFRGELSIAAFHFLFTFITFGIWQVFLPFLYNKQYMIRMLEKGYVLKDDEHTMAEAKAALGISEL